MVALGTTLALAGAIAMSGALSSTHPLVAAAPISALAPPGLNELDTHADDVTIDTERRELNLRGHVQVEASPFHLRAEALLLRRTARGIEVEGEGKLAFCPCLGTPLTLSFDNALVGPPSDLILRKPRLEIYGVPVMWLPYFWLRAPDRPGLLPPTIAYRGKDGLFVGAGAHLPWAKLDLNAIPPTGSAAAAEALRLRELGFDVRAGAYLKGGYAVEGDLRTPRTRTRVRWDWLDTGGLGVNARGSSGLERGSPNGSGAVWDIDALRGQRALASTLSLDEAARPVDRARSELFWREGALSIAMRGSAVGVRGADREPAFGPTAVARVTDALGSFGTGSVLARGGAYRSAADRTLAFSAVEAELALKNPVDVIGTALDARGDVAAASDGRSTERLAVGRAAATLSFPLVRAFESEDVGDPWRHRLEPHVATHVVAVTSNRANVGASTSNGVAREALPGLLPFASGNANEQGLVVVPEAGLSSALGRYAARDGFDVDLAAGYSLGAERAPIARGRMAVSGTFLALSTEGGARAPRPSSSSAVTASGATGVAVTSRLRIGHVESLHLEGRAGGRSGVDPTLARYLAPVGRDAPTAYFAGEGFSAGGTVVLPVLPSLTTRGGADFDLSTGSLLGARGAIDLRDRCGCVTLSVFGSHRLGREGVDVWLALEVGEAKPRR